MTLTRFVLSLLIVQLIFTTVNAEILARQPDRVLDIWPDNAPGENSREPGRQLPQRPTEIPPATRIEGITQPQLLMFVPSQPKISNSAVLIFPGGGYNYVVVDKEGSEVAEWLNSLGVTAFVVRYRTRVKEQPAGDAWKRPLEDGQRAVRLVKSHASQWGLDPSKIGVLGFSAGGHTAALVATRFSHPAYEATDAIDRLSCRPDFCMLCYPAYLVDTSTGLLSELIPVSEKSPPSFLVHAHDDSVTPLSSAMFYVELKQNKVPAELHIYQNGGHGYGSRPVAHSEVSSWTDRAARWLILRELTSLPGGLPSAK